MTLLDAARQDISGETSYDYASKLDLLGFSFGKDEDIAMKVPLSPISPLSKVVKQSAMMQPTEAVVHRVKLREFDERNLPGRSIVRRNTMPGGLAADGDSRRRSSSLSAAGGALTNNEVSRRPTSEQSSRPQLSARSSGEQSTTSERAPSADAPQARNLSSQEVTKRNTDTTEWFKSSRAINRRIRSIEDTETLVAKARERRESGILSGARPPRAPMPMAIADAAAEQKEAQAEAPAATVRRVVDPALLWGAKAMRAKPVQEEVKPEVQEALQMKKGTAMRGNVTVGVVGENGLLARLRRRNTIN